MEEIQKIKQNHYEIQRAIKFLADSCLDEKGEQKITNTKPVVLHSIKLGMLLFEYNYSNNIVIAGILHDLIEDAHITKDEIEKRFGHKVSNLVWALSFDRNITNDAARLKNLYEKQKEIGKEAIVISIADHIANLPYLKYAKDQEEFNRVKTKWLKFANKIAPLASSEPIYDEFIEKLEKIRNLEFNRT